MLAAASGSRRFIILVVFCCVSFLLFSLYMRSDTSNSLNAATDTNEDTVFVDDQVGDINNSVEHVNEITESKMLVADETSAEDTDMVDYNEQLLRLQQFRKGIVPPGDLFSKSKVTFPEDLPSGPTDEENAAVTIPYKAQEDVPSVPPVTVDEAVSKIPTEEAESEGPASRSNEIPHLKESPSTLGNNQIVDPTKNPALIIDTSGCKIPKLDPWDPTVAHLIKLQGDYGCPKTPLFMTAEPNGIIHLNVSVLKQYYNSTPEDMQCWYQAIIRKYEEPGNVRENDYYTTKVAKLEFDKPLDYEYIAAKCYFSNNSTHEQYLPLVKLKKEIEKERSKIKTHSPLNVILLGIDSISKLNFMRHFRKTKAILKKK